jgi:hypothetical protein
MLSNDYRVDRLNSLLLFRKLGQVDFRRKNRITKKEPGHISFSSPNQAELFKNLKKT